MSRRVTHAAPAASAAEAGPPVHPAGSCGTGHAAHAAEDRDSWCTPRWLTDLLPTVDLDPCSNRLSTVRCTDSYALMRGQDGLSLPWQGSLFVNPPYSDVRPWAEKLTGSAHATGVGFLVNVDPSTAWWSLLTATLGYGLFFSRRIQFTPPPGVRPSTNSKAQVLLMDSAFSAVCSAELLAHGTVWGVLRKPEET